jgi:uncharacterized protein
LPCVCPELNRRIAIAVRKIPYNTNKQINKHLLTVRLSGESNTITASVLQCDEVISTLRQQREVICTFHVASLSLFGSVARNEANANSDVDLLVEFSQPVGLFTLARLQIYLEKLLGCAIDLGTPDSIKPYMQSLVMIEAKRVF